jgi:hypothetical protein
LNDPVSKRRKVWGKRRFERVRSNELWQADFKPTEQDEWMISYLENHSRFVPGSRVHNLTAEHAMKLLEESMRRYGKPSQICEVARMEFLPFTEIAAGALGFILLAAA